MRQSLSLVLIAALTTIVVGCSSPTSSTSAAAGGSATSSTGPATPTAATTSPTPTPTPTPTLRATPVDGAFTKSVDAWCQVLLADTVNHQPPFYMGNPVAITREQLPEVGRHLDSLAMNHTLVTGSAALGLPQSGQAAWSQVLADFTAFQTSESAAISAAKASDLAAWTTQSTAVEQARDAILGDLSSAGLGGNHICTQLFGRGSYHG